MEKQLKDIREQQTLQMISELSLLDDDLMSRVFDKNNEATELVLRIILDIYAKDSDGKNYDIEVQRSDAGADFHRARYHSSMIDSKMLKAGQEFKEIHDSYVIFITENDIIGVGLPVYNIHRVIYETGEIFADGSHIIYVNGNYENNGTEIGKLIHDFKCKDANNMFFSKLAEPVRHFKETKGGQEIMCKAFEDLASQIVLEEKREIALNMLKDGKLSIDEVSKYSNLSLEVVKELQKELLVLS